MRQGKSLRGAKMRRRGLQVFVLVSVLIILSVVALALDELPFSTAAGGGPLGLTLGLDLQGGSLLIYEAELPDQASVTFSTPVEEADLLALLADAGQDRATTSQREYAITGISLADISERELRRSIEVLGPLDQLQLTNGVLEFTLASAGTGTAGESPGATSTGDAPAPTTDEALRQVLNNLGYVDAVLESTGEDSYSVTGLQLESRAEFRIEEALSQLSPTTLFELNEPSLDVAFEDSLARFEVQTALNDIDPTALVQVASQTSFDLQELSIAPEEQEDFQASLATLANLDIVNVEVIEPTPDQMDGVRSIIEDRINALGTTEPIIQNLGSDRLVVQIPGAEPSTIEMTFSPVPSGLDVRNTLDILQRTGDSVGAPEINTYSITTAEPLTTDEEGLLLEAMNLLGSLESFTVTGDRTEVLIAFLPPPAPSVITGILNDLGLEGYSVETPTINRFVIRLDDPLSDTFHEQIRMELQTSGPRLISYIAQGGFERAKSLIQQTAELELMERTCQDAGCLSFVDSDIGLTGRDLDRAFRGRDPTTNLPVVNLHFNSRGASIFRDLTTRLAGDDFKRIAIFLDQQEISAPRVEAAILDGRGVISGLTNEEARDLAIQLESGRLPVPLELIRENTVDALLGADSLRKSLIAGLIGLGLVLLFMVTYYRFAGLVAGVALLVYAVIILAVFKVIGITLILSGLAGLVLSIGMAVDANILIFERMKEELRAGRTLSSSMEIGFRRAWRAIRDSNFSTIITCLILFLFGSRLGGGTPVVTGFAITLGIGVVISMFTAYTVSRNLLQISALTPFGRHMSLFSPEPRRLPGVAAGRDR